MPKPARYALIWSTEQEMYAACEEKQGNVIHVRDNDQAWFDWLASRTSFSFQGRCGRLNLLKETRPRGGEGYWYAYVRQGKRTLKHYAGRTADLTIARLENLAGTLRTRADQASPIRAVARPLQDKTNLGPLLTSRLHAPRLPASFIAREDLVAALDVCLKRKLTLLSAPAGFGKTTLLIQWAEHQKRPVTWLSLDEEQNDPLCFLSYLMGALQQVQPGFGSEVLASFRFSPSPSLTGSIVSLLNELASLPLEMTMILDNYHLIKNPIIHNALTLLLDHLPPHIHMVIASRSEPPYLPARLRASGQMTELRTEALRLTRVELEKLLTSMLHLNLEPQEMDELEERIEGWISGVYLARSTMQGQTDVAHFLAACTGNNRHIQTYFLEEVLAGLPRDVQTFALSTVLLERCNSSLCAAVTGQENAAHMLEELARTNLFFCPLAEQEGWYRYHPLFASALGHHLLRTQPELFVRLHLRASEWFEAHALPTDAIKHALAARDHSRAATLLEEIAPTLISEGKLTILQNCLDALPEKAVRSSPRLCISRVWQEFITAQPNTFILWVEAAEQALHRLEETLPRPMVAALQSEIIALRSLYTISFDDFPSAITSCHQALQQLPADSHYLRGLILMVLGFAYTRSLDVGAAARALSEAHNNIQTAGHALLLPYVIMAQAELYATQGYPFQAAKLYRRVLALETGQSISSLFMASSAHIGLGNLLWEWNNLAEARHHLLQAWTMGQRTHNSSTLLQSTWLLAMIAQAQGDSEATQTWLQQLESLSQHASQVELTEVIAPIRAHFALTEERLEEALFWMREQNQRDVVPGDKRSELIDLTQARVLIAAGQAGVEAGAGARALELLAYWYVAANQAGRVRVLLEVLILQALALQLQHDHAGALHTLQRAITLAEPGRYIRLFVAEGDPLARLLRHLLEQQRPRKARGQATSVAYLSTLLKAFSQPDTFFLPTSRADSQPLFDPLSLREREVLHLIAVGHKNREIADELVVVTGTVKAHINMIYQKLGVTNRVQAITRARSLGLL
jgi:LuxR family maltose regulon positive regulatory protein